MHRDIKPSNILIVDSNTLRIKIIDFGLAQDVNDVNLISPCCGTPGYMAPEVANFTKTSPRYDQSCDVFSAGVIFYKL